MMKDCRPRRRLRLVATSATFEMRAVFFFKWGCCTKARRMLSPIVQASCSNGYHSDAPDSSLDGGRVGGQSDKARLSARSQAARTSSSDFGTEVFTAWKYTRAGARLHCVHG